MKIICTYFATLYFGKTNNLITYALSVTETPLMSHDISCTHHALLLKCMTFAGAMRHVFTSINGLYGTS